MKQIYILFISVITTLNFSYAQTGLFVGDFTQLSSWDVTNGELITDNTILSTQGNSDMTLAFSPFSQAIGIGDVLELTFDSNNVTNFATNGWAGISLYTGGSSGTEQIYIGSLGGQSNWGIDGAAVSQTSFTETSEIVSVKFTYDYDTSNWTLDIGGEVKNGTITSSLAINAIRIGADINNNADIAISNLSLKEISNTLSLNDSNFINKVTIYPNPSTEYVQLSKLDKTENYIVYNVIGTEIIKGIISNQEKINIQNFTNGLYFLKFDNGNTFKFIKE